MANYMDGMDGGKHNSDNIEHVDNQPTFTVSLSFQGIDAINPLEAAYTIQQWLEEDAKTMTYDVTNELTGEKFTVDMAEDEENAVLPNNENPELIKKNLIADIQKIIGEFGPFTTADIVADCDVSLPTKDSLIHLANIFHYDRANVDIYEDGGENEIDSYNLSYHDMDIETLEQVLKYAQDYEAMCLQDEDRQTSM